MFEPSNGVYHDRRNLVSDDNTRNLMRAIFHQRFLHKLQLDDDNEQTNYNNRFYSNKRDDSTSKKCTSVQSGTYYSGDSTRSIDNIENYEDCINQCEKDENCYGWAYQSSSKTCNLQNSIGWPITDASYVGGSCIGPDAKEPVCKQKLSNTIYNGDNGDSFPAKTVKECMKKCDNIKSCMGYMYSSDQKYCITQTAQYGSGSVSGWIGGSCVKPKPVYPPITIEAYRQQALNQHNAYRKIHCAQPLKLNATLNNIAQKYAEKLASTKTFEHSHALFKGQWMGENLYMSGGDKLLYTKGSEPVTSWYNEIKDYDWNNPGFSSATGHFTQVVWSDTSEVGIGRALTKDKTQLYIVGNYFPGGNIQGSFDSNVKPTSCQN